MAHETMNIIITPEWALEQAKLEPDVTSVGGSAITCSTTTSMARRSSLCFKSIPVASLYVAMSRFRVRSAACGPRIGMASSNGRTGHWRPRVSLLLASRPQPATTSPLTGTPFAVTAIGSF